MVEILNLLHQIRPFLIIKADKADLVLKTLVVRQKKHNWNELAQQFKAEGSNLPYSFLKKTIGYSTKESVVSLKRALNRLS